MHRFSTAPNFLRFADSGRLLIAGLDEHYEADDGDFAIAAQWQRFATYLGRIVGQVGRAAYGIRYESDDGVRVDYVSGVEVHDFSSVPRSFSLLCIPPQRCAVFKHAAHVSSIGRSWGDIRNNWLPGSGYDVVGTPYERYPESFDPRTGAGGVEIWIPLATSAVATPRRAARNLPSVTHSRGITF